MYIFYNYTYIQFLKKSENDFYFKYLSLKSTVEISNCHTFLNEFEYFRLELEYSNIYKPS